MADIYVKSLTEFTLTEGQLLSQLGLNKVNIESDIVKRLTGGTTFSRYRKVK